MDLKVLEPVFIEMSSALTESLFEENTTPEKRIEAYQAAIDHTQKEIGDSLLGRMITSMFKWHIDQIELEIRVFN